ncbi:MAG: restriction endonuclease subunit S [Verrucomicrobiae bacterium]|nr:restriction endonuclease subunit S [Verrucomicrobiae bacterium]
MKTHSHLTLLKDLAEVRSGYSFRSRVEEDPGGDLVVFQIRSLEQRGAVQAEDGMRLYFPEVSPSLLLRRGDVLFAARGMRNVGAVIDFDPDRAIASGQLLWMRPKSKSIEPAYLAWWLNQQPAQQFFESHKRGTRMPIITRSSLLELPVSVPSRDLQMKFVELDQLHRQERELTARIQEKREEHYEGRVARLMKGNL